jgi:site-specific DNA-methyltransferase (adenine-specific)
MGHSAKSEIQVGKRGRLVFSDNLDTDVGVPSLADDSVALTFTSPPYWNFVNYAGSAGVGCEDSYEGYLDSLERLFRVIERKTMPGGRLVVNASNMKSRKAVEGTSFVYPIVPDIIARSRRAGFTFFDEIIWVKGAANAGALNGRPLFGSYPYPPTPKILDSIFENIVVFVKAGKRTTASTETKERSRLSKKEWTDFTRGVWELPPDRDPDHPATFPIEIAERIIRMYSFTDDVVLDPFCGSGTTIVAAEKHGRQGIGFEISTAYKNAVRSKEAKWLYELPFPSQRTT